MSTQSRAKNTLSVFCYLTFFKTIIKSKILMQRCLFLEFHDKQNLETLIAVNALAGLLGVILSPLSNAH